MIFSIAFNYVSKLLIAIFINIVVLILTNTKNSEIAERYCIGLNDIEYGRG